MRKRTAVLLAAVTAAVLAFAFWYGGDAPGTRGFRTPDSAARSAAVASAPADAGSSAPALSAPAAVSSGQSEAPFAPAAAASSAAGESVASAAAGAPLPAKTSGGDSSAAAAPQDTCTVSISCAALLGHLELLDKDKQELVPEDGMLLAPVTAAFTSGESAFDVLQRVCKEQGIQTESSFTPLYNSAYIEGIGNLYEFDAGEQSGWMYSVNGTYPHYGSSQYVLSDGDTVCWVYTTDLGADVGGGQTGS